MVKLKLFMAAFRGWGVVQHQLLKLMGTRIIIYWLRAKKKYP